MFSGDPVRNNFIVARPVTIQLLGNNVKLSEFNISVSHDSGAYLSVDKVATKLHPNGVIDVSFTPAYPGT